MSSFILPNGYLPPVSTLAFAPGPCDVVVKLSRGGTQPGAKYFSELYESRRQAQETYFIRGQEIPHDLFSGGVSEEEISAALGFLCHSIVMISKYLAIALPYRIVCNSSRSAIQQDATTILPLFQARMVERDELQRAMTLVERNVACILKTRGIDYLEDSHILSKVNRIYERIVDGQR